jgi:SAM-dependent methyltransferase
MTQAEQDKIKADALAIGDWYHEMELFPGFKTRSTFAPGSQDQWKNIRKIRDQLSYDGQVVLDMGTMDGMWAFEAEKLGAKQVYAIDICQNNSLSAERFKIASLALDSHVIYARHNAHTLKWDNSKADFPLFDIIQCFGLLYHTQNPMLVLHNIAACLKPDGKVLLETACIMDGDVAPWLRLNFDLGIYYDKTTYSCPNWAGLHGMLKAAGLEIVEIRQEIPGPRHGILSHIHRVACMAQRNSQPLCPELGLT